MKRLIGELVAKLQEMWVTNNAQADKPTWLAMQNAELRIDRIAEQLVIVMARHVPLLSEQVRLQHVAEQLTSRLARDELRMSELRSRLVRLLDVGNDKNALLRGIEECLERLHTEPEISELAASSWTHKRMPYRTFKKVYRDFEEFCQHLDSAKEEKHDAE